ncbi:MAG: TonB-dependent receptor plug domain-containing protein [Cytophagales bacterium]|nr:TonB-dependent receptor plug domain-containing protein [Cytophagales bacterium]
MEALRLVPGVIVREQTNGNYDIHLRGMDYLPPKSEFAYAANYTTLVMIDNRIVFRDFQGGTYWESLPIDLNDVERIEVVRGPSSALYGPNAVSGVINIMTKRAKQDGVHSYVSAQAGTLNTYMANGDVSYKKDKLSASLSANYQHRDRSHEGYFDFSKRDYVALPDSIYSAFSRRYAFTPEQAKQRYPHRAMAQDKLGVNAFVSYKASEDVEFDLSVGSQVSEVQKVFANVVTTSLTSETSDSRYVNFRSKTYGADLQVSYMRGNQNTLGVPGWELDYENINASLEYEIKAAQDKLGIRYGLLYRSVTFDDSASVRKTGTGFLVANRQLNSAGGFIRADYRLFDELRLVAAIRGEK